MFVIDKELLDYAREQAQLAVKTQCSASWMFATSAMRMAMGYDVHGYAMRHEFMEVWSADQNGKG